ncbi:hypothetical protein V5735_01575 (plasmid) [Haladaptatus sp. SPP-AMP-3]|uniref:hypothetical protein n=1 Tax=Haladaptatus sp. SPP-AMP-3 TaxID=3121295 RepID=UPI003C2E505C
MSDTDGLESISEEDAERLVAMVLDGLEDTIDQQVSARLTELVGDTDASLPEDSTVDPTEPHFEDTDTRAFY